MTTTDSSIDISSRIKGKLPSLPFAKIKNSVLGKKYQLSLVFIGEKKSKALNRIYRNIDKPTDILSFPLDKNEGEIFINLKRSKINSKKHNREYLNFIAFLFVHGLVHLKGFEHGPKMESVEKKYRRVFNI